MTKRKSYPMRKGTIRELGFRAWFILQRGEEAYNHFVATLDVSPTAQAFDFKTTSATIYNWRRAYQDEHEKA